MQVPLNGVSFSVRAPVRFALVLLVLWTSAFVTRRPVAAEEEVAPSAPELLASVLARLPREPLTISGDITVRRRRGVVTRELGFEMALNWGSTPAAATYTIRDAFGLDLERMTVEHRAGVPTSLTFAVGDPLTPANPPAVSAAIQETDICWSDLTFSFLWWEGGSVVGEDSPKNRPCYVVEVPAPPTQAGSCAKMRLWIDKKLRMVLRAEACDAQGTALRRIWVRSVKKIDERWIVKEMEVQRFPSDQRTRLTIRRVVTPEASSGNQDVTGTMR